MKKALVILSVLAVTSFSKETKTEGRKQGDIYNLDSLMIQSEYISGGYYLLEISPEEEYLVELSRNFNQEIFEFVDRETVETKNDEN